MSVAAAKLLVLVGTDTSEMARGLDDASHRFQAFGDRLSRTGAKMTALFTLPVAAASKGALDVAVDFDTNMHVLEAVSQATGAEMAALGERAQELGADLTLPGTSAADAAEAMLELSKAGLSVQNTLAGTRGVLQLSAAGELSNAAAAEIAANALNMFNLAGEETVRVADLLSAAANASSAEVVDVADSLKMAGSVASAAGMPIEDLVAAISEMANAGIKGSDAGTSLKQMILSLQAPTDKAKELMQDLGIAVYDAQGQMLPMRELIEEFSGALSGLTQEQRNAALATIFGSDAVRAANIVMMGGVEAFDAMSEAVNREGAAAELAGAKMKGLGGAFESVKSAIETASLAAVQPFQQDIENLALGVADATNRFADLDPEVQKAIISIPLLGAAIGPTTTAVGGLVSGIGSAVDGVGNLVGGLSRVPGFVKDASDSMILLRSGTSVLEVAQLSAGGLAVTLGSIALIVGSLAGIWYQWNEQIVKTNEEGKKAAENTWKAFFNDQVAAGKDATQIMNEYIAAQQRVQGELAKGGIASLFIDRQGLAREGIDELNPVLQKTARSYDEYKQMMIDAGIASGLLHQSYRQNVRGHEEEAGTIAYLTRQIGLMTEAQWYHLDASGAQAAQYTQSAIAAAQYYGAQAAGIQKTQEAAEAIAETTQQTEAYTQRLAEARAAQSQWLELQDQIAQTEQNYLQTTGADMVSLLGSRLPESSARYVEGLGAIDEVFQTNYLGAYENQKAMEDLIAQYTNTGDLETFKSGMQALAEDGINKATQELEEAAKKAEELYSNLLSLPTDMSINIKLNIEGDLPDFSAWGWSFPPMPGPATPQPTRERVGFERVKQETRASGGPVRGGEMYWVGEEGPEPFIPAVNGRILSVEQAQEALRGESGGGASVKQVVIEKVVIMSDIDLEEFTWRVAERLAEA